MAGDWFPMREDLEDDPAVVGMASSLKVDELVVIGRLWKLWSLASQQTANGWLPNFTFDTIDVKVRLPGFAAAVAKEHWIQQRPGGLQIPNFENWLSESAKKRLKDTLKKRKQRANVPSDEGQDGDIKGDKKGTSVLLCPVPVAQPPPKTESGGVGGAPESNGHCAPLVCHEDAFEAFFAAYPKKTGKMPAARQWRALNPSREESEAIIAAVKRQTSWPNWRNGFIPNPANWLADRRWEDEEPPTTQDLKGPARPIPSKEETAAKVAAQRAADAERNSKRVQLPEEVKKHWASIGKMPE